MVTIYRPSELADLVPTSREKEIAATFQMD